MAVGQGGERIVFTIASRNYAAQAATLMESLGRAEPTVTRVVVCSDGPHEHCLTAGVDFLDAINLGPSVATMAIYYDAVEFNTALKPLAFAALMARTGAQQVVYLDPDIIVYQPLEQVWAALDRADIALTPHLTDPLSVAHAPGDLEILKAGSFNLGFMGVANTEATLRLVKWWGARCLYDCRVDFKEGLFTDQRWMDLAPGLVERAEILRQRTLNLAYWSLPGHELSRDGPVWTVDGAPLIFFHFSGFDPSRPDLLSKYQDRIEVVPGSCLADLLLQYAGNLKAAGYSASSGTPYGWARLADGCRLTRHMRRRALRAVRDEGAGLGEIGQSSWYEGPEPGFRQDGMTLLDRVAAQIWIDEPLLQSLFDLRQPDHRQRYIDWMRTAPGLDLDLNPETQSARSRPVPPQSSETIGAVLSVKPDGIKAEANLVPSAILTLWNTRADIRARFPDPAASSLMSWSIGVEAMDGRFDPVSLPEPVWRSLLSQDALGLCLAAEWATMTGAPARSPLRQKLLAAFVIGPAAGWPKHVIATLKAQLGGADRHDRTLVAEAIWRDRPDLRRLFDRRKCIGRLRFWWWVQRVGLAEYDLKPLPRLRKPRR